MCDIVYDIAIVVNDVRSDMLLFFTNINMTANRDIDVIPNVMILYNSTKYYIVVNILSYILKTILSIVFFFLHYFAKENRSKQSQSRTVVRVRATDSRFCFCFVWVSE